jgi:hypothetical protein
MTEVPSKAIVFSRSSDDLEGALMKASASSFKKKAAQEIGKLSSLPCSSYDITLTVFA